MRIYTGRCTEYEGQKDSANSEDGKCFTISLSFLNLEQGIFLSI